MCPEGERATGSRRAAHGRTKTENNMKQATRAHVRSKPPPHLLENFVHEATTTPQSPRLFHFRPPPHSTPVHAEDVSSQCFGTHHNGPRWRITSGLQHISERKAPAFPVAPLQSAAGHSYAREQIPRAAPALSIGANGGRMLANRGPAIVLLVHFSKAASSRSVQPPATTRL
jgi:hypothetical protein